MGQGRVNGIDDTARWGRFFGGVKKSRLRHSVDSGGAGKRLDLLVRCIVLMVNRVAKYFK